MGLGEEGKRFNVIHNLPIEQVGVESKNPETSRTSWPLVTIAAMLWALDLALRPQAQRAGLSSIQIVLFEHLALAILFLPALIRHRQQWRTLPWKSWAGLGFIAVFGSAIATLMITEAYRMGSPLLTALLQKAQPIFAVVLAGVFLREQRKPFFWPLFVGALLGTYLLAFGMTAIDSATKAIPVLLALGAAAIWGTCTVVGRVAIRDLEPSAVAGWRFLIALPFLLFVNAQSGVQPLGAHVTIESLRPVFLIVLFPDALGMLLYYTGLKRTPASLATLAELAFPATALLISLGDRTQALNIAQWIGLILLLVCLHLIQSSRSVLVPRSVETH